MGFYNHVEKLGGAPIDFFPVDGGVPSLKGKGWRIGIDWDDYEKDVKFIDVFAKLLATDGAAELEVLVIGAWDGALEGMGNESVVEALVAARDQLPNLRCLFLGDIVQEETEASWIQQNDVSPLFLAYPLLTEFRVRGTNGLSLGRPAHDRLTRLIVECGGLPAAVAREVASAELPELTRLELWLGDENYGRSLSEEDLASVLSGEAFPKLTYLGLRNDREADAMVDWLDGADVLNKLEVLDLSLGCLSDEGANKLAQTTQLKSLKQLDLHHHFCSEEATDRLQQALPGVDIDISEREQEDVDGDDVYRYNFVSE